MEIVPCTTDLRGRYRVHVQDPDEDVGQDFFPECRVHAICVKPPPVAPGDQAGTWYLITLKEMRPVPKPFWVHEGDGDLELGY